MAFTAQYIFSATGQSNEYAIPRGTYNLSINFTVGSGSGSVQVERSFDDGASWELLSKDSTPNQAIFTDQDFSGIAEEPEQATDGKHILWRFNCTDFTSGSIRCRISR